MKKELKRYLVLALVVVLSISCIPSNIFADDSGNTLYVATNGLDSNPGTIDSPLATIQRAVTLSKTMDKSKEKPVNIILRGGEYKVNQSIELTSEDNYLTFKSYEGEEAIITSAETIPVDKFKTVTDKEVLAKLPESARGNVKYVNLPSLGITNYGSTFKYSYGFMNNGRWQYPSPAFLSVNDKMMDIARWPNGAYGTVLGSAPAETGKSAFVTDTDRVERWTSAKYAIINGFLGNNYGDDSVYLDKVDVPNKTLYLSNVPTQGLKADMRFRIMNLIEELDIPNEFYLDRETGNLYFFPNPDQPMKKVRLVNKIYDLVKTTNTTNITFDGITFDGTCGTGINITGLESSDNLVTNCVLRNIGVIGVMFQGRRSGVTHCNVYNCGSGGIWLYNYMQGQNDGDITPDSNYIQYNVVEASAQYGKNYCTAINANADGSIVSHNRANGNDALLVAWHGNDNIFEYNDFYDAVRETGDSGIMYDWASYTNVNNHIRYNFFHSGQGPLYRGGERQFVCGLYMDNCLSGNQVYGNIFYDLYQPVLFNGGRYNTFKNNLTVNVVTDGRIQTVDGNAKANVLKFNEAFKNILKTKTIELTTDDTKGMSGNNYWTPIYNDYIKRYNPNDPLWNRPGYEFLKILADDDPGIAKKNVIVNNAYYGIQKKYEDNEVVKENGTIENNYSSFDTLPGFRNPETNEYEIDFDYIRKDVPGFEDIDFHAIGPGDHNLATGEFYTLYPLNGEKNVEAGELRLNWERSSGADKYRLIVARDPEFKDVVFNDELTVTYKDLTGLKYGQRTYYWKVQAISSSPSFTEFSWNKGGVKSFTTAMSAEINTKYYDQMLAKAEKLYNEVETGDGEGQCPAFYKENLLSVINYTKEMLSKDITQKDVEKATAALEQEMNSVNQHRNVMYVDLAKELLPDVKNWSGNVAVGPTYEDGIFTFAPKSTGGTALGYTYRKIDGYEILKFKVRANTTFGFTLNGRVAGAIPWTTIDYLLYMYNSGMEFQRYAPSGKVMASKSWPTDYTKWHDIEFGILNDNPAGPRFYVKINGEVMYDYVDTDPLANNLKEPGYFSLYLAGNGKIQLAGADAQVVDDDDWLY